MEAGGRGSRPREPTDIFTFLTTVTHLQGVGVEFVYYSAGQPQKYMSTGTDLSLRYAQGQVFESRKRFRVLVAGRRFGKSYLSCIELLRGAIERPGETFFYAAPTYRMAKDIAWKVMKKLVPKAWIKSKNETDLKIELVNGSTIELKGTENAMALRGRSLAGVVWTRPRSWTERSGSR